MRIGRNHGLQSPLVRAVPAVLVGMIAPDPLRIGPADVVQAGAGVQPQHLQGLAILAGKHLSVARNRLLHRRTGESRAQYIRRIGKARPRSEEHTSELQSLMRISYAVFCLKKKMKKENT